VKRIMICDSGLGGLNIASHFFRDPGAEPCELLYFNAYPAPGHGFNRLPDDRAREALFREVLQSMEKFSPDRCLVACNTLSIVYESLRKTYTPGFPVEVILDDALSGMADALTAEPEARLLILGTRTTVESGLYRNRLLELGFSPERIRELACPGLATLLEADPAAPEVRDRIRQYAESASVLFDTLPEKLFLALCCTHFEFAGTMWQEIFACVLGKKIGMINPNSRMKTGFFAGNFRYLARMDFAPGGRARMVRYFERERPEIAVALAAAQPDPGLFAFPY